MLREDENACQVDAISIFLGTKYANTYQEFFDKQIIINNLKFVSKKIFLVYLL